MTGPKSPGDADLGGLHAAGLGIESGPALPQQRHQLSVKLAYQGHALPQFTQLGRGLVKGCTGAQVSVFQNDLERLSWKGFEHLVS